MAENKELENIAKRIIQNANVTDPKCGSVILVLTVISVILSLVRVIQECNKKETSSLSSSQEKTTIYQSEIKSLSIRRGWFTKMRIKKLIKKELSSEDFERYGLNLVDSIITAGENITTEDTQTLIGAANV